MTSPGKSRVQLRSGIGVIVLLLTGGCLALAGCVALPAAPITYTVTPGKQDAGVAYQANGRAVTLEVRSSSGIGSAQLNQTAGPAPTSLVMRLYLKGLEEFTFQYPDATIVASISSHDGAVSETVAVRGGAAQHIGPDSPYWLTVTVNAAEHRIPLQDGYFEVQAPKSFLTSGSPDFTLRWVDFYR